MDENLPLAVREQVIRPVTKGGARPGSGRPRVRNEMLTSKFIKLGQTHGVEALELAMDIARHGEDDGHRMVAIKFVCDRGYGKELPDQHQHFGVAIVNVNTGVKG